MKLLGGMKRFKRALFILGMVFSIGYGAMCEERILLMATTTSTDNTGLLDYLAPYVKSDLDVELRWVAVGTGKALELGKNCDVDLVMVHAPESEKQYVEAGYGVDRRPFMFNDFVIVGPKEDPAGTGGMSVSETLRTIAKKGARFASRGDESGTHKKEMELWKNALLPTPERESWYVQTGQGMLATLNIAAEQNAYTLTDRGTFIKYESNWKEAPPLVIHLQGEDSLKNQYSVIAVNPERCTTVRYELASSFMDWITSPRAQKLIADFRLMGKQLFTPNAGR